MGVGVKIKMRWGKRVRLDGVFPSGTLGGSASFVENIKQKEEHGRREIDLAMLCELFPPSSN